MRAILNETHTTIRPQLDHVIESSEDNFIPWFSILQGNVAIGGENRVFPQNITLNLRPGIFLMTRQYQQFFSTSSTSVNDCTVSVVARCDGSHMFKMFIWLMEKPSNPHMIQSVESK